MSDAGGTVSSMTGGRTLPKREAGEQEHRGQHAWFICLHEHGSVIEPCPGAAVCAAPARTPPHSMRRVPGCRRRPKATPFATARPLFIEADSDRDVLIANGVEIGGRIGVTQDHFQMRRGKGSPPPARGHLPLELHGDRESVTMEDRHVDQLQRKLGSRPAEMSA